MNETLITRLIEENDGAFYILNSKLFEKNFLNLKETFKKYYKNFNIAYSYKTNYIPKLCKIVDKLGGYAEVVSEMEAQLALKIGVKCNNIIWNGPVKNLKFLGEYSLKGMQINIDNLEEAVRIQKIALDNPNNIINVGLRCNYDVFDGVISRFGFDVNSEDFIEVLKIINNTSNLKLISLQAHFAKRQIEYWKNKVSGLLNILDRFKLEPKRLDVGGGLFGKMRSELVNQFTSEIPTYEQYAKLIGGIIDSFFDGKNYKPELIIEPGTALVGDCMQYAALIDNIKNIRGKFFASTYASQKNINMVNVNPPIDIIHNVVGEYYRNLDIVGYTCIENDVLYKNYSGKLGKGDIVVFSNCGSYSIVMKPPFIFPNFAIIDIDDENDNFEVVKKRETFMDIFNTYKF